MKNLSPGSGNGQRRRAGITKLLACVIFAASAFIPGASTPSASTPGASTSGAYAPPPMIVTVNDDGTFTPYEITIEQGEKIKWEGLDPTDSIVQISGPKLVIPAPDPCGIKDNIRDHAYDAPRETRVAVGRSGAVGCSNLRSAFQAVALRKLTLDEEAHDGVFMRNIRGVHPHFKTSHLALDEEVLALLVDSLRSRFLALIVAIL